MHALCIHFKCFASFLLSFYRMLGFKLCLVGRDQFPLQQQQISCQNLERHSKQQDVCLIFPPFLYLSIFHQCECIKCEDYRIFCQNYWYEISFGLFIMRCWPRLYVTIVFSNTMGQILGRVDIFTIFCQSMWSLHEEFDTSYICVCLCVDMDCCFVCWVACFSCLYI